jgi:two-component system chemotaxis response regulator CheV
MPAEIPADKKNGIGLLFPFFRALVYPARFNLSNPGSRRLLMADILLESGTNEMELLVFRIGTIPFGINVAKVREIIQRPAVIKIPHAPREVEGSFQLREEVLTLVNIGRHFEMEGEESKAGRGLIVLVEFNQVRCGILVDSVEMIHRLRWDAIEPPSEYLTHFNAPVTGMAKIDNKIVMIVDFESIIGDILGKKPVTDIEEREDAGGERASVHILLADDSMTLRTSLVRILRKAGYDNLTVCVDGQMAWDHIEAAKSRGEKPCDLVLSDIEMPRMDGLHLTSRVKGDPELRETPVVLFSSLISADNIKKCQAVGADALLSKPDSEGLIAAIETCLQKIGRIKAAV